MQIFWVVLVAIIWVVASAASQKKKQQAKREAEAKAATQSQPARPAPAPVRPTVRPSVAPPPTPVSWAPAAAGNTMSVPRGDGRQGEIASSLTELAHTQRHTLAPSHKTGHAHQETSMTGFEPDCPPITSVFDTAAEAPETAAPGMPAFTWQPDAVRDGFIYAEILSKPKALRG